MTGDLSNDDVDRWVTDAMSPGRSENGAEKDVTGRMRALVERTQPQPGDPT